MDSRCRYFYNLYLNNDLYWSGYLLHEEAWIWLNKHNHASIEYFEHQVSNMSNTII